MKTTRVLRGLIALLMLFAATSLRAAPDIRLATTTSTEASGLLAAILPQFEARYGGKVRVVAVGSRAARCHVQRFRTGRANARPCHGARRARRY
jgi:ABC-type tungstate transport system permease subunit